MTEPANPSPSDEIIGYQVDAVQEWVSARVSRLVAPFVWTRLEGGHSNLTYRIDSADGGLSAVIRRPPLGELLPKAHDMSREWACISALWPTPVPVAEPLAFCEDPTVTGAHFYVMGLVKAKALYTGEDVEEWLEPGARQTMAESWIDTLAELHALDPDEIGIGDLGRKEDYVLRQLRTWYRSWNASIEAAGIDRPEIHAMHDRLVEMVPDQGRAALCHGDYGTHNVMVTPQGRVGAVVDWELGTLGDPLADFAYSLNSWLQPGDPILDNVDAPTLAPGFPDRQELTDRYGQRTGRDLSRLDYYLAFNRFKTACILHGVFARYRNGQKAIDPEDLELMHERTNNAIVRALLANEQLT